MPTTRWALARTATDKTVTSALTSAVHLLSVILAVIIGASVAGFRGALAGSTLLAAGITLAVGLAAQDVLGAVIENAARDLDHVLDKPEPPVRVNDLSGDIGVHDGVEAVDERTE